THDVTEAVKLGDRIAILAEHAQVAQYDTPAAILAEPADEFVASFIGAGAAIRRLRLEPVGSIDLEPVEVVRAGTPVVRADQSRHDALEAMLRARQDSAVVVDEHGHPVGALTWSALVQDGSVPPARKAAPAAPDPAAPDPAAPAPQAPAPQAPAHPA